MGRLRERKRVEIEGGIKRKKRNVIENDRERERREDWGEIKRVQERLSSQESTNKRYGGREVQGEIRKWRSRKEEKIEHERLGELMENK